jgi:MFS family permease
MAGSLLGGWFNDRIGRRKALAISSFLSAIGVAIMYVSYLPADLTGRRVCFMMGKLAQGIAIGGVMAATQTYMSEILPPVLRGSGMAFFPAITLLGQLTGALVIYGSLNREGGYAVVFGSQWPFSVVPIVVAFFIPESPTWYVRKRYMEKAHAAQARLDPPGVDTSAVVAKILATIEHEELSNNATFFECFHKRNFRRTFIVMWANSLTAIFGLQLLAKASYFLQLVNMKPGTSIIFLILGIVLGLIANIISIWVMSRVGRRPCVLWSMGLAILLWTSMGVANCTKIVPAVTWYACPPLLITEKEKSLTHRQVHSRLHDDDDSYLRHRRLARLLRHRRRNLLSPASRQDSRNRLVRIGTYIDRLGSLLAVRVQPRRRQFAWQNGIHVCGELCGGRGD